MGHWGAWIFGRSLSYTLEIMQRNAVFGTRTSEAMTSKLFPSCASFHMHGWQNSAAASGALILIVVNDEAIERCV